MRRLSCVLLLAGLSVVPMAVRGAPDTADDAWTFDSNRPASGEKPGNQGTIGGQVYGVLQQMIAHWNSRDIDGYMDCWWKSPDLLFVQDGEQIMGWVNLRAAYQRGFPDRNAMGVLALERVKVQPLGSDAALALCWWTVTTFGRKHYATDTTVFRHLPEGWRAIASHATYIAPGE